MSEIAEQETRAQRAVMLFNCLYCHGPFTASRRDAKFCSDACRKAYERKGEPMPYPREIVSGQSRENYCATHQRVYLERKMPAWAGEDGRELWLGECPGCGEDTRLDQQARAIIEGNPGEYAKRVAAEMERRKAIMEKSADYELERLSAIMREKIISGGEFVFSKVGLAQYEMEDARRAVYDAMHTEIVNRLRAEGVCQAS